MPVHSAATRMGCPAILGHWCGVDIMSLRDGRRDMWPGACASACGYMHVRAGVVCTCLCIGVAGGLAHLCVRQGVPHVLMGA